MITVLTWIITVVLWILSMVIIADRMFNIDDEVQRPTWKRWILNTLRVAGFIYIIPLIILIPILDPFLGWVTRIIERHKRRTLWK